MEPKHASDEDLLRYAGGKLSGPDWDSIDSHISNCEQCQNRVEDLSIEEDPFLRGLKRGQAASESEAGEFLATQTRLTDKNDNLGSTPVSAQTDQGEEQKPPEYISRYKVERLLGEGGFGRVYLARDTELDRRVAVKVPTPKRLSVEAAESYRKRGSHNRATRSSKHRPRLRLWRHRYISRLHCLEVHRRLRPEDEAR